MEDSNTMSNDGPSNWRESIPSWGHQLPFVYILYTFVVRMAVWLFVGVVMSLFYFVVLIPIVGFESVASSAAGLGEMVLGWFSGVGGTVGSNPWGVWFGFVVVYMFHLFWLAAGGNETWSVDEDRPPLWRELGLWSVVGIVLGGLFVYVHVVENILPVPVLVLDVVVIGLALLVSRTLNLTLNEDEVRFGLFTYGPAWRMAARLPFFYLAWVLLVGVYSGLPPVLVWGVATLTPVVGLGYVVFRVMRQRARMESGSTKSLEQLEEEIDDGFWEDE